MSRVKCTSCGLPNRKDSRACFRCGALLLPVKPLSKPMVLTLIAIGLLYAVYYGLRAWKWGR